MSDPDAPDGTSSEAEESQVGGDKPIEAVNPMAEVFQSTVNPMAEVFQSIGDQPPPKDLSPEEKEKGKKGCLIAIGVWIAVGVIVRIIMGVVGEDEVEVPTHEVLAALADPTDIWKIPLPSSVEESEIGLSMRRKAAHTRGLELNQSVGFGVLTGEEYECVGELAASKSITLVELNGWFEGEDLGPGIYSIYIDLKLFLFIYLFIYLCTVYK